MNCLNNLYRASRLINSKSVFTDSLIVRSSVRRFCSASTQEQLMAKIKQQVTESPVVLYMKGTPEQPQCGFSNTVVRILEAEGATYTSHNVLADSDLREGIKTFSNWPTLPQVYIDGEFVGGADIMMNMYKSGELETLLKNSGKNKN
ncbi:hypothetical protein CYY_000501 [Polysphondylium violaceum]|uniref:Glutaredoxin domain-containing protein n=1 Tax=Polysphondylium violaceum TaxID=133409 RepID=A0A8J4UX51_9MYCE|nr:hypothetical protein CYY_000501 [Polysphondylium violaceum]